MRARPEKATPLVEKPLALTTMATRSESAGSRPHAPGGGDPLGEAEGEAEGDGEADDEGDAEGEADGEGVADGDAFGALAGAWA